MGGVDLKVVLVGERGREGGVTQTRSRRIPSRRLPMPGALVQRIQPHRTAPKHPTARDSGHGPHSGLQGRCRWEGLLQGCLQRLAPTGVGGAGLERATKTLLLTFFL